MSESNQFRQYAEEALRWGNLTNNERDKNALLQLARTWTQAAVQSERVFGVTGSPPKHRAPYPISGRPRLQANIYRSNVRACRVFAR